MKVKMVWGVGLSVYASTSLRLTQGKLTQQDRKENNSTALC